MKINRLIRRYEKNHNPAVLARVYMLMYATMQRFLYAVLEEGLTVDGEYIAHPEGDESLIDEAFIKFAMDVHQGELVNAHRADLVGYLEDLLILANRQSCRLDRLVAA